MSTCLPAPPAWIGAPTCLPVRAHVQTVRFLHDTLSKDGYRVVMLHGERSQPEREDAMRSFRGGKAQVRAGAHGFAATSKRCGFVLLCICALCRRV